MAASGTDRLERSLRDLNANRALRCNHAHTHTHTETHLGVGVAVAACIAYAM